MKGLLRLFLEFFRISLFVIGGGYSILVVADRRFAKIGWTAEGEIIDHLPVFQTIPGLIATHTAVYVGRKRAGALGALISVIAVAIPAIAIFTGLTMCYREIPLDNPWLGSAFVGLRAALTGIIAATIIRSWRRSLPDVFAYCLMVAGVMAIGFLHVHIALVLVIAMLLGMMTIRSSEKTFNSTFLPLLLFAQYGALCFGGGFVLVPMYINDFVGSAAPYLQIAESEFGDIMALSQMTPGPIGVNCATFFGFRLAGVAGALIASALLLLPGSVLVYAALSSLEKFKTSRVVKGIMRGIRPASIALMLVALTAFAKMTVYCDGTSHHFGAFLIIIATALAMYKKTNIILLIVICALTSSLLRADDGITTEKYPDADTVVVNDIEEIEYFPDGTYNSVEETWEKILTEAGRQGSDTVSMDYSRRYGNAKIAEVKIISPDGTERIVDIASTMKDTTDNSSTASNIYDPLDRRIVCAVPGLKVGDTLYVRKERGTFAARCKDQWADLSMLETFTPILRASVRVKCPAERPLKSLALRNPLGNTVYSSVTNADGSVVMEWCTTNSPQAFHEPNMPAAYRQLQHVLVSTAADWQEISKWYWELCVSHLAKTNAAMIAKVDELKQSAADRDELLRSVYKFVSQEIRYMGLTMEDTSPGYAPHDVDITFNNRYGVCRDKAGLLVAMLRLAGFDAYPVLIMAGTTKKDAEVPNPYFNHAIVAVETGDSGLGTRDYILMDPTDESSRDLMPSYLSDCSYLVARPDGDTLRTTPMPSADDNMMKAFSRGTLAADGSMTIESVFDFKGLNDNAFRRQLLRTKPDDRRKLFERMVKALYPGAMLLKCEITPEKLQDTSVPLKAEIAAYVPEAVLKGKDVTEVNVGLFSGAVGIADRLLAGRTSLEKRRFPLRISSTAGVSETLVITFGDVLGAVKVLPEKTEIDGPYEYRLASSVADGELRIERTLKVNSLEFSPEEYPALREHISKIEAVERQNPVFENNRERNADVHIILDKTETGFTGERSWVTTNTSVREILTYDGKKRSAERKFYYNPKWEQVKVVAASVTSASGKTVFAGEKEMNELDCGWAANAPRYPSSRELIVTLPSVEIGSVITTVVERTVNYSPAGFDGDFCFDAFEPTDEISVKVGDYERTVKDPVRLPDEALLPPAMLWRDMTNIVRGTSAAALGDFRKAASVKPVSPALCGLEEKPSVREIRDWMAKHVRIAGPSLYELPLEDQLTDPALVIKERYATRLDYIRTLTALLRSAGFEADVVFAMQDRGECAALREYRKQRNLRSFSISLCRVRTEGKEYFLGLENEYTPLADSGFIGCDYLDPADGALKVVKVAEEGHDARYEESHVVTVRENGAVDYDYEQKRYGEAVGSFRKFYAELLPEETSRRFRRMVAGFAESATATSELVTDIESYPARLAFSCYAPDYAVVNGDMITITAPDIENGFFALTGPRRENPISIGSATPSLEHWKIVFPEGYVKAVHLPDSYRLHNPLDPKEVWYDFRVDSRVENNHLVVEMTRIRNERLRTILPKDYFAHLKDWSRLGASRAECVISVSR